MDRVVVLPAVVIVAVPALAYEEAAVTVAVESLDDRKGWAGDPPHKGGRVSALPDRLPMEGFSNGITSALTPILARRNR